MSTSSLGFSSLSTVLGSGMSHHLGLPDDKRQESSVLVPLYLAHCKVFWTTLWGQPLSHLFPGPQLQYSLAQAMYQWLHGALG